MTFSVGLLTLHKFGFYPMQIICYLILITIIDYSQSDFRVSYGMQNVNNKGVIYAANTI